MAQPRGDIGFTVREHLAKGDIVALFNKLEARGVDERETAELVLQESASSIANHRREAFLYGIGGLALILAAMIFWFVDWYMWVNGRAHIAGRAVFIVPALIVLFGLGLIGQSFRHLQAQSRIAKFSTYLRSRGIYQQR